MTPQFTTPCFIRKSTPELRKKLEEMGYLACSCATMKDHEWLHCANEHLNTSGTVHGIRTTYDHDLNIVPSEQFLFENEHNTDCGTNEALFLDLAWMRKDTDKNQLYIANKDTKAPALIWGEMFRCDKDKCNGFVFQDPRPKGKEYFIGMGLIRRATAQEIINYYKQKGEKE